MESPILIVDDSKFDLLISQKVLSRALPSESAIDCITAFDGVEALELLTSIAEMVKFGNVYYPKLILLDLNMPRMDGFEFLKNFQIAVDENKLLKSNIIVLSSSSNEDDINRAKKFDCVVDFLIKPLNRNNVFNVLLKYIA